VSSFCEYYILRFFLLHAAETGSSHCDVGFHRMTITQFLCYLFSPDLTILGLELL
jgi:hypothetical protein